MAGKKWWYYILGLIIIQVSGCSISKELGRVPRSQEQSVRSGKKEYQYKVYPQGDLKKIYMAVIVTIQNMDYIVKHTEDTLGIVVASRQFQVNKKQGWKVGQEIKLGDVSYPDKEPQDWKQVIKVGWDMLKHKVCYWKKDKKSVKPKEWSVLYQEDLWNIVVLENEDKEVIVHAYIQRVVRDGSGKVCEGDSGNHRGKYQEFFTNLEETLSVGEA